MQSMQSNTVESVRRSGQRIYMAFQALHLCIHGICVLLVTLQINRQRYSSDNEFEWWTFALFRYNCAFWTMPNCDRFAISVRFLLRAFSIDTVKWETLQVRTWMVRRRYVVYSYTILQPLASHFCIIFFSSFALFFFCFSCVSSFVSFTSLYADGALFFAILLRHGHSFAFSVTVSVVCLCDFVFYFAPSLCWQYNFSSTQCRVSVLLLYT